MFVGGPYNINNKNEPVYTHTTSEVELLSNASALLDVQHLSEAAGPVTWPVRGILYGPCKRPLVCLPTALGTTTSTFRNIIYLVDSCAPTTELDPYAFGAFGDEAVTFAAHANINGMRCHVRRGARDIPVLGADYMSHCNLSVLVDYKANTVTLDVAPCGNATFTCVEYKENECGKSKKT